MPVLLVASGRRYSKMRRPSPDSRHRTAHCRSAKKSHVNNAAAFFAGKFPWLHQLLTTRLQLLLAVSAAFVLAQSVVLYAQLLAGSEGLFTKAGPIIGGDFIVFREAAKAAGSSDMSSIYDMENLRSRLHASYPGNADFDFAWMYPPTMSLVVAPFAIPTFLASFALWVTVFLGAFLLTISRLSTDRGSFFLAAASPAVFQAVITGQNGFLTGTLLALAAACAETRPIVAGVAAGLLTVKPQLGLLVPVAFLAAGCWRAFAAAVATTIGLAAASVLAFGAQSWIAFLESITAHGARMGEVSFPFHKLVTPYGFAAMLGMPSSIAGAIQLFTTLALVTYVFVVWSRVKDWDLRLAALSTSAVLSTPYAFYYELAIVVPAMLVIGTRAAESGWLRGERLALVAVWILPLMMPGARRIPGLSICATGALLAFLIAARRTLPAAAVRSR
jgi:alpha-1,2-mannosyltransferase